MAEDGRGGGQKPQDAAEWPLPLRPARAGRSAGQGSGAGNVLRSTDALKLGPVRVSIGPLLPLITTWLTAYFLFSRLSRISNPNIACLNLCGSSRRNRRSWFIFLSFKPPWRLTGPQTGEQCAILEDEENCSLDSILQAPSDLNSAWCGLGAVVIFLVLAFGYLSQASISKINSFTFPVQIRINRSINPAFYKSTFCLSKTNSINHFSSFPSIFETPQ